MNLNDKNLNDLIALYKQHSITSTPEGHNEGLGAVIQGCVIAEQISQLNQTITDVFKNVLPKNEEDS